VNFVSKLQIFCYSNLRNIYPPEKQENIFEKYVLKVYIKPSRKNKDFVFKPDPILPVWVKIGHLKIIVLHYLHLTQFAS
jgi:hypothetical protein